ncbi:uncharacterized protein LOC123506801 isoform X3 [Portunus trituberculatus]|nr:uncharacterized protein LOC123506801 isoform X3 [Portunus trituberculatus]
MRVWGVSMAWTRREGVSLAAVGAVIVPMVASLVTYTFVSLPGEAIALDQTGSLVVLLVLLKIFVLGISGHLPFDLNKLWSHHGRREKRTLPYLLQESLEEDLPCTVRILCELETAARTSSEDELPDVSTLHHGEVDTRGQTTGDGDRVDGTLLEVDHVVDFHEEAVAALFQEDARGTAVLSLLAGLTGPGLCEAAYAHCPGSLTARQAMGVLFNELHIAPATPMDLTTTTASTQPATPHPNLGHARMRRNQTLSAITPA